MHGNGLNESPGVGIRLGRTEPDGKDPVDAIASPEGRQNKGRIVHVCSLFERFPGPRHKRASRHINRSNCAVVRPLPAPRSLLVVLKAATEHRNSVCIERAKKCVGRARESIVKRRRRVDGYGETSNDGFPFRLTAHSFVDLRMTNGEAYLRCDRHRELDVSCRPRSRPVRLENRHYSPWLTADGDRRYDRGRGSRPAEDVRGRER